MATSLSLAASLALVLAGMPVSPRAQNAGARPVRPVAGPLGRITYDVATGAVTRLSGGGAAVRSAGAGRSGAAGGRSIAAPAGAAASCFLNTNTMGFFGTGTTDTEWRDWAGKDTGKSDVIRQFYFAYATSANDVIAGGLGAAIEVAFYTGETGFCTSTGQEIAGSRFCFTGLPGVLSSLPTNTGVGFAVTAFAPAKTFCVPDGKVGWSYGFKDDDGSGSARTGPLMTSFVTANTCAADAFDLYSARPSSDGTCAGSFSFGGCEPLPQPAAPVGRPCANLYVGLGEEDAVPNALFHEPLGCNSANFASTGGIPGPAIGLSWESQVDPVLGDLCHLRVTAGPCHNGLKPGNLNGTALYAVSPVLFTANQNNCGGGVGGVHEWNLAVQKNLNLVGVPFCAQSLRVDFPGINVFGENAENLVVGASPPVCPKKADVAVVLNGGGQACPPGCLLVAGGLDDVSVTSPAPGIRQVNITGRCGGQVVFFESTGYACKKTVKSKGPFGSLCVDEVEVVVKICKGCPDLTFTF